MFCQKMFLKILQNSQKKVFAGIILYSCRLENWNYQKQPLEMFCKTKCF